MSLQNHDDLRELPRHPDRGLAITRTATSGEFHVAFAGELDLMSAPVADRELRRHVLDGHDVVLDLRGLTFMDAAGLAVVVDAGNLARRNGRRLAVRVGTGGVQRLFALCRAERSLEIIAEP